MEMSFNCPKQVIFADPNNKGEWICGIAYKDEIICACCGSVFEISEVVEQAAEDGIKNAIYPYENWLDVSVDITGGELPSGLDFDDELNIIEIDEDASVEMEVSDIESTEGEAIFVNTWVDGISMPSV